MHIVFFGSHPDDESFANGTIAKYVDRGHSATIVVATHGSRGHWEIQPKELVQIRRGQRRFLALRFFSWIMRMPQYREEMS